MVAHALSESLANEKDFQLVGTVSSASEAAETCRRLIPDVGLMDFRLSDGDGVEATKAIRSRLPETKWSRGRQTDS